MRREYTLDEMLEWLEKWLEKYKEQGYTIKRNSEELLPARVPLYCVKKKGVKIADEIVLDITTSATISNKDFFPTLRIGKVMILQASPLRFYQYYFPKAKIFLAYPDYVDIEKNDEFNEFKKICIEKGIGLLRTSQANIKEVVTACSLFDDLCKQLEEEPEKTRDIIGDYMENYSHYLIYYPAPDYKRRAITGRTVSNISFILIDKLSELKNVTYKEKLKKLAFEYRQEARDDYKIALDTTKNLWAGDAHKGYTGVGVEYPEIQRRLEDILLQNPEYRDHFLHQFQVFLSGAYIIDKLYDENKEYIKKLNRLYKCRIEKVWLLASTYHDFNYSIQEYDLWIKEFFAQALSIKSDCAKKVEGFGSDAQKVIQEVEGIKYCKDTEDLIITEKLTQEVKDKLLKEQALKPYQEIIERLFQQSQNTKDSRLSSLNLDAAFIRENFLLKTKKICKALDLKMNHIVLNFFYEQVITERNHGLLSALSLLKLFENAKSQQINHSALVQAAVAIALHDENIWKAFSGKGKNDDSEWKRNFAMKEFLKNLKFENHPLVFLLIFYDTIQEWGRVGKNYGESKPRLEDVIFEANEIGVILSVKNDKSYKNKMDEIERVAKFLKDQRFVIVLKSRASGKSTKIPMTGVSS